MLVAVMGEKCNGNCFCDFRNILIDCIEKLYFLNEYSILFAFVLFYKHTTLTISINIYLYFHKLYLCDYPKQY